jgi:PKD domain
MSALLLLAAGTASSQAQSTIRFQEGVEITVNGVGTGVTYAGTKDTYTHDNFNNANNGGTYAIGGARVALLRFEDIFGGGVGQIPVGSTIQSASLSLVYIFGNGTVSFGQLDPSQTWTETSTQFTFSGGNGIQYGTEATLLGGVTFFPTTNNVTSSLSAWSSNPALNNGWVFTATSNTGWASSDFVQNIASRPVLTVTFSLPNAPPTANAGPDQSIHASDTVLLDGSDSFDDNTLPEDLDYQWSFDSKPTGSTATFDNATSQTPSFVADKSGTYTISLVVYDDEGLPSVVDTVDISSSNLAPTAVATVDYSLAIIGQPVTFDGSGSTDPDGDEVFYDWVIVAAPAGSTAALVGGNTAMPTLTPDVEGVYEVTLEVSDFLGPGTSPASVEITATTASGYAEIQIVDAFDQVAALTGAQVTTQGNQQAFSNFLTAATQNLQQGKVSQAIAKLNQAILRTDGCALRGSLDGNGPGMDWITDCGEQDAIYDLLTAALDALQN